MIFTKNWTKDDNKKYRQLIKEHRDVKEIIDIMGIDKLKYNPNGSFTSGEGIIKNFKNFLTEIVYTEKFTKFNLSVEKSKFFNNQNDYTFHFKTDNNNDYVFDFIYFKDHIGPFANRNLYNLSFTTLKQKKQIEFIEDYKIAANIYNIPTGKNEQHDLIKRLIYLFNHFHEHYGKSQDVIYIIGETEDPRKTSYYINLIKSSFDNVVDTIGESSINNDLPVHYFEILENKSK